MIPRDGLPSGRAALRFSAPLLPSFPPSLPPSPRLSGCCPLSAVLSLLCSLSLCCAQDFYNLVNVYLDAVLHPRATSDPLVLQQEGWHLELDEPSQPLTYKGVVYNEMKVTHTHMLTDSLI